MLGRNKTPEYTEQLVGQAQQRDRAEQLERDPSTVKGLTRTELNSIIDTGSASIEPRIKLL